MGIFIEISLITFSPIFFYLAGFQFVKIVTLRVLPVLSLYEK